VGKGMNDPITKDNQTPIHRHSIRLKEYDYSSPGAYFITVVTHRYKCIFGKIIEKEMQMNDLGMIVRDCWINIPEHFMDIEIEPYVIMPNHIHGIITIHENDRRGTIYRAPKTEKYGQPVVGSVPTIMRTYKAAVSRIARRESGMVNIWQRNYYEHIIRDRNELQSITQYILANAELWNDDPENPHPSQRNLP
jgi:putative transposase